jgi:uncharacterized protein (DUF1015 family)
MATVIPFRGLVYDTRLVPDLRLVVAPPYDVISAEKDEAYRRLHPHNIVHLILPRPEGESDKYACAAGHLQQWVREGILVRDEEPAFYLVAQKYTVKGIGERTRLGLIARLRIEDEGNRIIRPHERTMSGPREDRMDLLESTMTNLSQVFLLYSDPGGSVTGHLGEVAERPADRWAVDDAGIESSFWRITSAKIQEALSGAFREKSLWIADGHHRYSAARALRDKLRTKDGSKPGTRAYDYVMSCMTAMESPGVTILPYHRTLHYSGPLDRAALVARARPHFDVKEFSFEGEQPRAEQIRRRLRDGARSERNAFAVYTGPGSFLIFLIKEEAVKEMEGRIEGPLKSLDVSVVHHVLLDRALGIPAEAQSGEGGALRFTDDIDRAMAWVDSGEMQAAFLLNATLKEQLVEVADHGLQMPQKSTYFYPKVLTGLILNPLEPIEEVHLAAPAAI